MRELNEIFRAIHLKLKVKEYLCVRPCFSTLQKMNDIKKIFIKFKNLVRNIQRTLDHTLYRKDTD